MHLNSPRSGSSWSPARVPWKVWLEARCRGGNSLEHGMSSQYLHIEMRFIRSTTIERFCYTKTGGNLAKNRFPDDVSPLRIAWQLDHQLLRIIIMIGFYLKKYSIDRSMIVNFSDPRRGRRNGSVVQCQGHEGENNSNK